jgi:glycine/sarcosine N-methyltransferase
MEPEAFYDALADDYHLIFADWERSIAHQADVLSRLIGAERRRVLDAACGIGTQAIGLARDGYDVTATDVSAAAVARCAREAEARGLSLRTGVADLRFLPHGGGFDAAIVFDNALPHLRTDADLAAACTSLRRVLAPDGLLCASIRDYDALLAVRPPGELPRSLGDRVVFQTWQWHDDDAYTVRHFILTRAGDGWEVAERETVYRALRRAELTAALEAAGFARVAWRMPDETGFYQPVVTAVARFEG